MSNNDESETPIEDKQNPPPKGNIITDIIKSIVFITLAAYGSSSFIYMLHISSEEKRKMKEADDGLAKGDDFSVLSGSYIYGPPYFPNEKNVINFNKKNDTIRSKLSMANPKNFNDPKNTILKVKEQKQAIAVSLGDKDTINKYINKQWDKNCPKKYNEVGENLRSKVQYSYKSRPDSLHDWLYSSNTVCNPSNLKENVYSKNTWKDVANDLGTDLLNFILSWIGLDEQNDENLNNGQIEYRKKLWYNIYRYTFFIVIGTFAFIRNILNKMLKYLSFDNNEFEYWDKNTKGLKSPFSRKPYTKATGKEDYDNINKNPKYIKGIQSFIALIFACLNRSIFPMIMTSGLFVGGIASIIFALYKWNFTTMFTWWSASAEKGPFLWFIFSIISLLFWILGIYLMFIIPGFVGYVNSFVVVAIIIMTLFIYPFFDNTSVYVKTLVRSAQYVDGNYAKYNNSGGNKPVESQQRSNVLTNVDKNGKLIDKKCVNIPLPGRKPVLLDNVKLGNNKFVFKNTDNNGKEVTKEIHKLDDSKCYENFIQKKSGFAYIKHLVGKNRKFWMSLLLHDIVRFIDADTSIHEIAGQKITILGNSSSNMSINFGTIPLLYYGSLKLTNVVNYFRGID